MSSAARLKMTSASSLTLSSPMQRECNCASRDLQGRCGVRPQRDYRAKGTNVSSCDCFGVTMRPAKSRRPACSRTAARTPSHALRLQRPTEGNITGGVPPP